MQLRRTEGAGFFGWTSVCLNLIHSAFVLPSSDSERDEVYTVFLMEIINV